MTFGGLILIAFNCTHRLIPETIYTITSSDCALLSNSSLLADRFQAIGPSSVLCRYALPPNPIHSSHEYIVPSGTSSRADIKQTNWCKDYVIKTCCLLNLSPLTAPSPSIA